MSQEGMEVLGQPCTILTPQGDLLGIRAGPRALIVVNFV